MFVVFVTLLLLKSSFFRPIPCTSLALVSSSIVDGRFASSPPLQQVSLDDVPRVPASGSVRLPVQDKIKRQADNGKVVDDLIRLSDETKYSAPSDDFTQTIDLFSDRIDILQAQETVDRDVSSVIDLPSSPLSIESGVLHSASNIERMRKSSFAPIATHRVNDTSSRINGRRQSFVASIPSNIPRKVDWREKGVISPVIYQGKCGACWAYSSLATIESMAVINNVTREVPHLSAQQLIDCGSSASPSTLNGCEGGDTCAVLSWLKKKLVRIVNETEYPSRPDSGQCLATSPDHGIIVKDYRCNNFVGKEHEMIHLLANHGPLTATVDASSWPFYLGGVIKYNCESGKTHAIQIVGYNLLSDTPYYIVKNSWGSSFGLDGYLHIAIGSNLCGIAEDVSSIDVTA